MGHPVCQLLAILCVVSSLALIALVGSDPTRRVSPSNPELWQTPLQSWGLYWIRLPYPVMHRVCCMWSQVTRKIIFTMPTKSNCYASSAVTPRGYKVGVVTHAQPTSSRTISSHSSASFPMTEKKRRKKQI
jgi:hypothetical protein